MQHWFIGVVLSTLLQTALAAPQLQVFVSFSMPEILLEQTLDEAARLHIPAYLNGLYHNSMPETAKKILTLANKVPALNLAIDPTAFERFGITQVPALVVESAQGFDVLYGNLTLTEGLLRIANRGDSGLSVLDARRIVA